jgi:transposase
MLDMLKRHAIQVLRKAGHTHAETAKLAGASERSVRRIEDEPLIATIDTEAERGKRKIGRPRKAEAFRAFLAEQLGGQPDVLSLELLRRARLQGYQGGKSALYALIATLRPPKVEALARFEGLPGEFSQHDFGHVDVRYMDGSKERVHFFASRLKFSRTTQVTLVPNEQVEPLVRTLVEHFEAMGGVPLVAVFDRPKTVALSWRKDGTVIEWNSTFGAVALELGIGVEVCWPRSPWQKGSVENLVGWVKGSFFKQRRFLDREDLYTQLRQWLDEVNTKRLSRATGEIPATRMVQERPRLRPLKVAPADLALRIPVAVGPTGMVLYDTHQYSVPPDAIGISGTLYLYRDRVRIIAGRFEALHERLRERGAKSVLPEHRTQMLAAVSGKRGRRYLMRQQILEVGPPALDYLTELVHRRPDVWLADVERLHDLLQTCGPKAMHKAFDTAVRQQTIGAEYVAHYLAKPAACQEAAR